MQRTDCQLQVGCGYISDYRLNWQKLYFPVHGFDLQLPPRLRGLRPAFSVQAPLTGKLFFPNVFFIKILCSAAEKKAGAIKKYHTITN